MSASREQIIRVVHESTQAIADARRMSQQLQQLDKQTNDAARKQAKEAADEAKRQSKERADAEKKAAKEATDAAKNQARERADADKKATKEAAEARKKAVKEAADAEKKAAKEAADETKRAAKDAADERKRLDKQTADEQKNQVREAAETAKIADRERTDVEKAEARKRRQIEQIEGQWLRREYRERVAFQREQLEEHTRDVEKSAKAVESLVKAYAGLSAAKEVISIISSELQRAAQEADRMSSKFADIRRSFQEIAALKDKQNDDKFVVGEVAAAASASLKPDEWGSFQKSFQSYGGAYLEGDQARFKDRDGKTAAEQAEEYQKGIAEFTKAHDIPPDEAARLGGALLQFSDGPQTVGDLKSRYGKVFKTLERAPTPVKQLLPQMSGLMAQGLAPEEAAKSLGIMSEATPGEESTHVENTLKAITNVELKGKGQELGITKGMTAYQKLEAAARTLAAREKRGEDMDKMLKEYAPDIRERRGFLGFVNRGVKAKGFERTEGYVRDTPTDFVDTEIGKYRKSDAGRTAKRDADLSLAEAKRGASRQRIVEELEKAKIDVTKEGQLDNASVVGGMARGALGRFTGVDANQQLVNIRALENVHDRARKLGVWNVPFKGEGNVSGTIMAQQDVDKEILATLKKIEQATAAAAKKAPGPAQRGVPAPIAGPAPASRRAP